MAEELVESRAYDSAAPLGRGEGPAPRRPRSGSRVDSSSGFALRAPSRSTPEVLLMDEPCSALDPIATGRIEELMKEIQNDYTIVIVTHNMQQAARVSDRTAFFTAELDDSGNRRGRLVEFDETSTIFSNPADERTEAYVTGTIWVIGEPAVPARRTPPA